MPEEKTREKTVYDVVLRQLSLEGTPATKETVLELLTTTTWMSQNPKCNPKMHTFDANQAIRMMVRGTKTKHAEEGGSRTLGKRELISQI